MKNFVCKLKLTKEKQADSRRPTSDSFVKSEDGLMTIFGLFLILIIFTVGGFAVDIMRFDHERARLQYSLDRAVLAAADLEQDLCPKVVIKDYLEKEGLSQYLVGDPIVTPDLCGSQAVTVQGYRRVEASAKMDVKMHFMQWWEVDSIATSVVSVAEEAIGNVEISMVLDVSGSMNSNNRLTTLKLAAQNFVQEMVDKTEDGKLSISIVPYATQVSLPDSLMAELQTTGTNTHANCINFENTEFSTSSFDRNLIRKRTLHFTHWGNYDRRSNNTLVYSEICESDTNREIMVHQKDADTLKQKIADFKAGGNTSIDLGVKWGLTLLDESFRPVVASLAAKGDVPAEFAARPANVASGDTMKVMVLMTDGANTSQYWVNDPHRAGKSGIWWNEDVEAYVSYAKLVEGKIYTGDNARYYWPNVDIWEWDSDRNFYWAREQLQPAGYGSTFVDANTMTVIEDADTEGSTDGYDRAYIQYRCLSFSGGLCSTFDYSTSRLVKYADMTPPVTPSEHLTWPTLWESTTRYAIYNDFRDYYGSTFAYDWYYDAVSSSSRSTKDPRVTAMCSYAKNEKKIVIFTIALEAPSAGKAILKSCQSDDGAYYEATVGNLPDVFASIGSSIRNLRLTQ
ncbi:pilus assembly protein TadG-related protein [Ruegeria sp. EL01]|jgi:Flp pilus assembly protein TadG|uniref:pilus assembly protein TadG-related protein n=1 Tax=Ruegeria sp. EL01 TaxID=2107578 RepID=UPI000EA801A8|nr:pilus assembly protein TadG-related protein [Ruegeria sp. EL01]